MAATDLQLGPRIRSLRQARHVTLRELAERAGVTESFLSQVEREVTSPSIASVQRIARALDLGIADLFADEAPLGRAGIVAMKPRFGARMHDDAVVRDLKRVTPAQAVRATRRPRLRPRRHRHDAARARWPGTRSP